MRKYSVTEKVDLSNNPVAVEHIHMKLFRAQRNEYIAGFALLLCLWVFFPMSLIFYATRSRRSLSFLYFAHLNMSLFGTGALAPVSEHDQLHGTVWFHLSWWLPADFWTMLVNITSPGLSKQGHWVCHVLSLRSAFIRRCTSCFIVTVLYCSTQ